MAYQMVATAVTLNDLEGHSPLADVYKCNPSNICAAFYAISTVNVLSWFLCISRASCCFKPGLGPGPRWELTALFLSQPLVTSLLRVPVDLVPVPDPTRPDP